MRMIVYGTGEAGRTVLGSAKDLGVQVTKCASAWDLGEELQRSSERVVIVVLDSRHVHEARKAIGRTTFQVTILLEARELQDVTRVGQHDPLPPDDLRRLLRS